MVEGDACRVVPIGSVDGLIALDLFRMGALQVSRPEEGGSRGPKRVPLCWHEENKAGEAGEEGYRADMTNKTALIILDGWGIGQPDANNAVHVAATPCFDELMQQHPNATLTTHGEAVGLPEGQMGNSEVDTNIAPGASCTRTCASTAP